MPGVSLMWNVAIVDTGLCVFLFNEHTAGKVAAWLRPHFDSTNQCRECAPNVVVACFGGGTFRVWHCACFQSCSHVHRPICLRVAHDLVLVGSEPVRGHMKFFNLPFVLDLSFSGTGSKCITLAHRFLMHADQSSLKL